jgi:hypothetical protein
MIALYRDGAKMNQQSSWTIERIATKLAEIKAKGYIGIPDVMFRSDEGVVGQILEREFNIRENNLRIGDLGEFELKGMRRTSSTLTLCHRSPESGLNPIQIFDRFGYIRPSNRDRSVIKKKLFCTVTGKGLNSLNLRLQPQGQNYIGLFYMDEFICRWNLSDAIAKISQIILVFADTTGKVNSKDEKFHYVQGFLFNSLKPISDLVNNGQIVIDFCIDRDINSNRGPHDRGPHIRMPRRELANAYNEVKQIL